ncbi:hypothetical protein ACHAXS_009617 [Conticribra weissflogii]
MVRKSVMSFSDNKQEIVYDLTSDGGLVDDDIVNGGGSSHRLEALDIEREGSDSSSLMNSRLSVDSGSSTSSIIEGGSPQRRTARSSISSGASAAAPSPSLPPPLGRAPISNTDDGDNIGDDHGKKTNLPLLTTTYMSALTTGATTYAFSFYSNALKTSLRLSQSQLDTLSSATFCAGILSWMPGMAVDLFGARRAMALGGMGNTIMLSTYWMIATGRWEIQEREVLIGVLSALGVLTFVGCALITGSVFKVIMESCGSGTKGKAVGCAKGYVGVGSGVYVCLFRALFGGSGGAVAGPERGLSARNGDAGGRRSFGRWMGRNAMLPTSTWIGMGSVGLRLAADVPTNPDLNSLNFLLMAAVLSFTAATLPALMFLPKQTSSVSACAERRDGTRSIHFRVIYAGLIGLGMWVVGMSLMELKEESDEKKSRNSGVAPSLFDADHDIHSGTVGVHDFSGFVVEDELSWTAQHSGEEESIPAVYSRKLWLSIRKLATASTPERHWGTAIFLLLLWWGPALSLLCIPPRKEFQAESSSIQNLDGNGRLETFNYDRDDGELKSSGMSSDNHDEEETFLQEDIPRTQSISAKEMGVGNEHTGIALGSDFTLMQMLRTRPAWLMAWTCVIIVGGGTVMTNNIGQMTEALGFDPDLTSASLALFSAAQAASRVMTGSISESALKWKLPWYCGCITGNGNRRRRGDDGVHGGSRGLPRPAFLVVASLISALSHSILSVATTEEGFAFGVTMSGVAFGMVWPLMVLITGEVFGYVHYGANYMFYDGFSSAAGTLLLSKYVAQTVYDEHIVESHGDPGTMPTDGNFKCYGTECFRMTQVIVSFLSLTCVISSIGLIWSTKEVYHRR